LQRQIVDLDDDAVDFVIQSVALLFSPVTVGQHVVDRRRARHVAVDRQAERFEILQQIELRGRQVAARERAERVAEKRQAALGGEARILLA